MRTTSDAQTLPLVRRIPALEGCADHAEGGRPNNNNRNSQPGNDWGKEMTATTMTDYSDKPMTSEQRMVIFASSLGTVFEWYDFYIYGTLGAFLAKYFFSNVPANVGFIFALLAFAAGFAVRPFGALIFGRLGDMIGRKYTFLVTMSLMGVGTFFIGVLPGYATLGHHWRRSC